ncbi:MAG: DUF642 domain-containing protein [Verrucomicrobiaceae bacterium]|nr:DUF642 domain-containing protein [Verrucomicrobiaceae bacterium]
MKTLRLFALLTILPLSAFAGPFSNGSFEQAGITTGSEEPLSSSSTTVTGWTVKASGTVHSAADDYSATLNNSTRTWQYGYRSTLASSSLTLYSMHGVYYGSDAWSTGATTPSVIHNGTAVAQPSSDGVVLQPNQLFSHPGNGGVFSVVRWTAPAGGPPGGRSYAIHADWVGLGSQSTVDVHVLINGISVYDGTLAGRGTTTNTDSTLTLPFTLPAGMTVEFAVGDGGNGHSGDSTGMNATITEQVAGGGAGMIYERNTNSHGVTAVEGSHVLSFGHNGGHGGTISQTFDTVPGATYQVAYSLAQMLAGGNDGQTMSVEAFNGSTSLAPAVSNSLPTTQNQWGAGTIYSFTATSTSTKLVFNDTTPDAAGANTAWALDSVNLAVTLPAVLAGPEEYNGHTYFLVNQATWQGGENEAVARGGHLVTIDNASEQTWVFNTFKSVGAVNRNLWIGLREVTTDGNYLWVSGETPQPPYMNWHPTVPDNLGGNENYAHMFAHNNPYGGIPGSWNDSTSPPIYPFVEPFASIVEVENTQPIVSGYANVWLAGHPNGTTARQTDSAPADSPKLAGINVVGGRDLVFTVGGGTSNGPSGPALPADGANIITHDAENSIASLTAPLTALVGVFLDASVPSGDAPEQYLDYTSDVARDARHYTPGLRQPFYIGDGLTAGGIPQTFRVPSGATRLFLGALDAYDNHLNFGSFVVGITEAAPIDTIEPPPNLVSWWPGENSAWDVAGIGRGSMKNAAHNGMDAYGPGKVGRAFVFDGVDDHIQGRPAGISLVQELTIEAWINPSSVSGEREIISKRDDNNTNVSYALFLRDGHLVYLSRSAGVDRELADTGTIPVGVWTHVVMTESYTAGRKLYVNGNVVASASETPPSRPNTSGPLSIGAYVTTANPTATPGAPFAGSIDELTLFNRALSSTEISLIVSVGAGGKDRADPARDFSPVANPNTPWKYGWIQAGPISPTYLEGGNPAQGGLFPKPAQASGDFHAYMKTPPTAQVIFNVNETQRLVSGALELNPLLFVMNPSSDGSFAVLRWTAPASGRFAVSATFTGAHDGVAATSDVHVLHNSDTLFDSTINSFQGDGASFTDTISVGAGDTVDWLVGGNGTNSNDHTGLVASVVLIDHSPFQIPTLQDFKFTGTLMTGKTVLVNAVNGERQLYPTMTAKLQYSPTPWDDSSWLDVPGGTMTPTGSTGFTLLVNTLPAGHFAFRIATSVSGVGDSYSAPSEMYDVLPAGAAIEIKVTAVSDSDATGATTHRGDYIDYLVQFRNTGGNAVLPASQHKIEAKIPTGTSYFNSSPAATPLKTSGAITGLSWPIIRNLNPVDMMLPFTAKTGSDVITVVNHGFDDGDTVELRASTTGTLPGGLREGIIYKVTSSTSNSLKLIEPGRTTSIKCTNTGIGTHTMRRESDTWQKRLFTVSVTDPTKVQDTPTPVINPVGGTIVSDVKMKRATGADIPAAVATTTVVNPLRLTGTIRGDSQMKQGGIVNIDFKVTNGASYTTTGTNLVVRAPAGLTLLQGSAFVNGNETGGAPIDPVTRKQIPGYYPGKPNPYLEEDTQLNQLVTFNLGNMLGGTALTCRVSFRIQYDWNPALPISFNNAIVSIKRPGTGASTRNPVTGTLLSPLVINVAAAPFDPRPALALTITQEAAGILPGNSAVAVVIDRNDMVAGSSPQRSVRQIVYRMTYRNYGNVSAEFVRMAVPLPANTTYVSGTAVVKLAPNDKNPTGTSTPAVVGSFLIFNLPHLEKFGVLGYEKTLEFRVTVKSGLPTGTRIIQQGGSVTTRDLGIASQARHQLEAEVSTPAVMRYKSDGFTISNGSSISEVRHRHFYENTGTLPASGVEIRYAIPTGYKFVDAVFLNANGTKNVIKSLSITKPLVPTSGTVIFPVGTVNRYKLVKGVPVSGGGFAVVRLQIDPDNPPTSANDWRRDGSFTHTSTVPAPPPAPMLSALTGSQGEPIKLSLAPSKLYVGVFGAAYYAPEDDPANERLITYQVLWGSNSNQSPGAGAMLFPIPANTTYVRHTPSIVMTGGAGESGNYSPPGSQFGGTNGKVSWGLTNGTNTATTAFVTVRINDGFTGTVVCDEAYASGDRTGKRYQMRGRTTVYAPGESLDSRKQRLANDSVGNANLADRASKSAGFDKFIRRIDSINAGSSWMNFSGTDAFTVAGNNAVLIPLGGGKIVAAGGGNIVAAGGGNIVAGGGGNIVAGGGGNIVAGGGGNIVAAGGGNIVAAGGGNIFSGVTNIVAAGGGNIVAAGGGNFVKVDVPGRGMLSATDLYKSMAQIVAAGGGNIVAGGGGNLVDLKNAVVANDGAGLVGLDGASLVGMDGASFGTLRIEADGALKMIPPTVVEQVVQLRGPIDAVIANDGAGLTEIAVAAVEGGAVVDANSLNVISQAALLGQDGASLLGQDGASIIGEHGAGIIGEHGAGFKGMSAPFTGGVGFGSGQR